MSWRKRFLMQIFYWFLTVAFEKVYKGCCSDEPISFLRFSWLRTEMKVLLKIICGVLCCICAKNFCVVAQAPTEDFRQLFSRRPLIDRIRQRITPIQDHIHQHHNGLWSFLNNHFSPQTTIPSPSPPIPSYPTYPYYPSGHYYHHHHHHDPHLHGHWHNMYQTFPTITTTTTDAGKKATKSFNFFYKILFSSISILRKFYNDNNYHIYHPY